MDGNSLHSVRMSHERGEAILLRDRRPDLPELFLRVVERALQSEPAGRFSTTGQMAQALNASFAGYGDLY